MKLGVSQSRQRGIIILAFTALLLVLAAAVMVTRANRIPSSVTIDTTSRAQLVSLLNILKQQLIVQALGEDNTPGTLPCPNSPSCSANAAGLAGTFNISGIDLPAAALISLPNPTSPSLCVQYVVAPSLRNSLGTSVRGTDPAQKEINPAFDPDLLFIDNSGTTTKAWAVLLANTSISSCSLSALGYQLTVNSSTGIATLSANSSASMTTASSLIQKRDMISGLLAQALVSLDANNSFDSYLASKGLTTITNLAAIRTTDTSNFDAAMVPIGSTPTSGTCPGVQFSSSSSSSASSASSSSAASVTYKSPVSWLCFNGWYDHVNFDPTSNAFMATDSGSSLKCTRRSGSGQAACTY
ncbi:MAG: hypothetical protein JWN23_2078 [Rhodocyclales bacterium]|nr:hypothetical protein [Rhodocyclales bacterium]